MKAHVSTVTVQQYTYATTEPHDLYKYTGHTLEVCEFCERRDPIIAWYTAADEDGQHCLPVPLTVSFIHQIPLSTPPYASGERY